MYLTYLEEAATDGCATRSVPDADFVIVRIAIDYRRELSLDDEEVTVTCRGVGYGTSSIRTAERIIAKAGWVAAESESVIVAHDRGARSVTAADRCGTRDARPRRSPVDADGLPAHMKCSAYQSTKWSRYQPRRPT